MSEESVGVLERERQRAAYWRGLVLPDPIAVIAAERATELKTGQPHRCTAEREQLDRHFQDHPEDRPRGW